MADAIKSNKFILKNAFIFSDTDTTQQIVLRGYEGLDIIAIYSNGFTTLVTGSEHVVGWSWDRTNAILTITRAFAGAWANAYANIVFLR